MKAALAALLVLLLPASAGASDCFSGTGIDSTCNIPVEVLGSDFYISELEAVRGDVYPGGLKSPSTYFARRYREAVQNIYPRAADGTRDDTNGWIGVLWTGNSNAGEIGAVVIPQIEADGSKRARIKMLRGDGSGRTLARTARDGAYPEGYWGEWPASSIAYPDKAVEDSLLDDRQVQVIAFFNTEIDSMSYGLQAFSDTVVKFFAENAVKMDARYPNLQLIFIANSTAWWGADQAGAPDPGGEPKPGYWVELTISRVMEAQAAGLHGLSALPLICHGPCWWRDGVRGGHTDGRTWVAADFDADGIHYSAAGEAKCLAIWRVWEQNSPEWGGWYYNRNWGLLAGNRVTAAGPRMGPR